MRFRLAAALVLVAALVLPGIPARAADVTVGGQVIFRIDDGAKADELSQRLENLLQGGASAWAIKTVKKDKAVGLYWGDTLIVLVTPELAKANGSTPAALAELWASNLRTVAKEGLLKVDRARVELPVGGEASVQISGLAVGDIKAVEASGGVSLEVDQAAQVVVIRGRAVGKTKVDISRGKGRESVWVHVKDWAGKLPDQVSVEVTGNPAPGSMIAQAALAAAAQQARVKPGCQLVLDEGAFNVPSVPSGDTMRFSVPVGITGSEDYFPVHGQVPVVVNNLPLPFVESNLLLVSNRPERVDQDGILLEYTFSKKEPARLMYSHLNETRAKRNLWVNLTNPTSEPVRMVVSWTYAGPERNEVHVGQTAAKRFMEALGSQAGYVLTIPPRSAVELASHVMAPKALVNGFATFRILEGEKATVEVRTALAPARNDGSALPHLGAPFNPFKIHPHGVFAQPFFEHELEYTAGSEPLAVRYGESPWLIDFETGLPNTGNFGVLYKMLVDLYNPDSQTRQVAIYFHPLAGPAGGTFLVDGKVYQASFRRKDNAALVTVVDLAPGETKSVEVVTFPEASSNYPAQVEFRDAGSMGPSADGAGGDS